MIPASACLWEYREPVPASSLCSRHVPAVPITSHTWASLLRLFSHSMKPISHPTPLSLYELLTCEGLHHVYLRDPMVNTSPRTFHTAVTTVIGYIFISASPHTSPLKIHLLPQRPPSTSCILPHPCCLMTYIGNETVCHHDSPKRFLCRSDRRLATKLLRRFTCST